MNDDLLYLIALKKIPLVGDITARKLLTHFGSAQRIFAQSKEKLEKLFNKLNPNRKFRLEREKLAQKKKE
mgnify:CR=1 FL=1